MRMVDTREAQGYRLAQRIVDGDGRTLLATGVPLTAGLCEALVHRGFMRLFIEDGISDGVAPENVLVPQTRALAMQTLRACLQDLSAGDAPPLHLVTATIDAILADLAAAGDAVLEFAALQSASAYTYTHSVNVCVYSLLVARSLGYAPRDLRVVGAGALLHDVGKLLCADICCKPGPLDEEERVRVRQHPQDGFEMLRRHHELHLFVAHMAFQHHERMDGSGYPRGLRGEQILPCARIVAVVDAYDAMTADRPYARARPPDEAMAEILRMTGSALDAVVVQAFMRRMAIYPAGTPVLLADGCIGIVVTQTEDPHAPLVRPLARAGHILAHDATRACGTQRILHTLPRWPTWLQAAFRTQATDGNRATTPAGMRSGCV